MSAQKNPGTTDWKPLLLRLGLSLLYIFALVVLWYLSLLVILAQWIIILTRMERMKPLEDFATQLIGFIMQVLQYIFLLDDQRPFPFNPISTVTIADPDTEPPVTRANPQPAAQPAKADKPDEPVVIRAKPVAQKPARGAKATKASEPIVMQAEVVQEIPPKKKTGARKAVKKAKS